MSTEHRASAAHRGPGSWILSAGVVGLLAAGCASTPSTPAAPEPVVSAPAAPEPVAPKVYPVEQAPAELKDRIATAKAAVMALQGRLAPRLLQEIQRAGAAAAIQVCRQEAQAVTQEVAKQQGIELGRTSFRLRNPVNAPRDWAKPLVEAGAGKKFGEVTPVVVDLGERIGFLPPIPTGPVCVQCHGPSEKIAPEVSKILAESFPEDRATGFQEGDLRGFFWVELSK